MVSEIVGRELKRWEKFLDNKDLDEYERSIINIILEHYGELIESGGTAGGKRANKMAEYIKAKKGMCDQNLVELSLGDTTFNDKKIKRIDYVELESFRGFACSRKFSLNKQYVFLYGPNGSGKSSFSEALEYGLLGIIQESETNGIRLAKYIKNIATKKGVGPKITCKYDDGSSKIAVVDYEAYKFAFIEKNRITDFSHISALNQRNQNERLAALF